MPIFRPKPVEFEGRRVPVFPHARHDVEDGALQRYVEECVSVSAWCGGISCMMHSGVETDRYYPGDPGIDHILVPVAGQEAYMVAEPGDWILRGQDDDFYPRSDEFVRTMLEPVGEVPR